MQDNDKRNIFHENDRRFEKMNERYEKAKKRKRLAIYAGAFIALSSSFVVIKKQIDYLNQPATIVVNDIMANEHLLEDSDGRKIEEPRKFGPNDLVEMYAYARENNLDPAVLRAQIIHKYIQNHKEVDEDLLMDQLEDKYPGILNNDLIITIERDTESKAK